jgi:hypothetical protein
MQDGVTAHFGHAMQNVLNNPLENVTGSAVLHAIHLGKNFLNYSL